MSTVPPLVTLLGQEQYRIIPSVYPPINFFEQLVAPEEMEALWEIEGLTNERLREETGDLFLVKKEDRVSGPGASVVMAAFTHLSKPSRFSDGSYGIYYAGLSIETAVRETVYHREIFLKATSEPAGEISMRLYQGTLLKPFHDVRHPDFSALHHPSRYTASQPFGQHLRNQNAWGILYPSARHAGGQCVALLRPPATSIPQTMNHLKYLWNGQRITEVLSTQRLFALSIDR